MTYIKRGKVTRGPCAICGTVENIEAHHANYSKPLEVVWLCRGHHVMVTMGLVECPVPVEVVKPARSKRAKLPAVSAPVVEPVDLCPHVEWLEQEGESYACRLSAGHKGKCARGERIA